MKDLFPHFADVSDEDYENAWKSGLFVFDTNVLLNSYRYREATKETFYKVLDALEGRIWVPNQVALEFYRNRVSVIGDQIKKFDQVKKAIDNSFSTISNTLETLASNRSHSAINPEKFLSQYQLLVGNFKKELDELENQQQTLTGSDSLRDRLEKLFEGKVGFPIKQQPELDDHYKLAETRFKFKIPPGYLDDDKDKDEPDEFLAGGLIHKRKYGDYIIWIQILAYAKSNNLKYVIFITDDNKDDWWWKRDVNGKKIIGPRPELIEEIQEKSGVKIFLMYNSERFLERAQGLASVNVSSDTLSEVREVSEEYSHTVQNRTTGLIALSAVTSWAKEHYKLVLNVSDPYVDLVFWDGTKTVGVEIITITTFERTKRRLLKSLDGIISASTSATNFIEAFIVLPFVSTEQLAVAREVASSVRYTSPIVSLKIIIGELDVLRVKFTPIDEVHILEPN